jgi:MFS family permease
MMVGMFGVFISLGYLLGTVTGLGFYFTEGNTQWRGPFGLSLFFPVLISVTIFLVPESPRYLLMQGRVEDAKDIVFSLHAIKGDEDQNFARSEFYQMSRQAQIDRGHAPTYVSSLPSYCSFESADHRRLRCSAKPAIGSEH